MTRFPPLHEVDLPAAQCFSLYKSDWRLEPLGQPDRFVLRAMSGMREVATIEADGDDWNVYSDAHGDRGALTLEAAVQLAIRDHLGS